MQVRVHSHTEELTDGEPTREIKPDGQSTGQIKPGEGESTEKTKADGEESNGAKPKATIAALGAGHSSAAGKKHQTVDSIVPCDTTDPTATTVRH